MKLQALFFSTDSQVLRGQVIDFKGYLLINLQETQKWISPMMPDIEFY